MSGKHRCATCQGEDVQVSLPAWFKPNDLEFVECDDGADPLSFYCNTCGENGAVIRTDENGKETTEEGRW